jgi:tetratricopeptide (TPR) repeat protein
VDSVLVDEATWRATERQISYQPAEAVQAKGKADPVGVWEVLGARASLGVDVAQEGRAPLVGRSRELGLLADTLARARGEQIPQLVTLVGVPGMGKSRLVFELLQLVEAEPELTIWRQGHCLPYGKGVALWALGELVKAQAGILDTDPAGQAETKLTEAVADLIRDAPEAAWVTGQLRPLVGLTGETEIGADRKGEAFAAWRRFLEGLAEQSPAVLVVEDLHWADEVLLDFLDHLVDWAAEVPLLVVATARPELLVRRPDWGGGKPNAATISLSPLSERDTARLVAALLDQVLLPAELQAVLLTRSGGNPLYAEEYVRMLADRGFLRRTGGAWRLEQTDQLPLPETVQGIIAARLDALSAEEKALLQDAAVLGKVGWLGALAALGDLPRWTVEQRMHALERRELLRRERGSQVVGERQYAFRHVLVRDVAHSQLPRAARADKHRRVAQWIQTLPPDRAEDRAELLAHHWQAALEFARAAGHDATVLAEPVRLALREAGDRALDLNAFAAAGRWYAAALALWPTADPERPQLQLQLGRARFHAESTGDEVLAEARDGLLAAGDRESAAEAEALLGELSWRRGRQEAAFEHHRRAVVLVEGARPSRPKALALVELAAALWLAGDPEEAIQTVRKALTIAEALGLLDLHTLALEVLGGARLDLGDLTGLDDLERAVAIAVPANSPEAARAQGNLSFMLYCLGDPDRSGQLHIQAQRTAERFGVADTMRGLRATGIWNDYQRGSWDAALGGADEFIAESEGGMPDYSEPLCRIARGHIRLARDDLSGAVQDAEKALVSARLAKDPQVLHPVLAFRARALLRTSRTEEAKTQVGELMTRLGAGRLGLSSDWLIDLAAALEPLGQGTQLREVSARTPISTPWVQAAAAFADGEFERAADIYAQVRSFPDEAFARLRAAERLVATGRRAEGNTQLQRAIAFYRQVHASAYLREAEALVAASA